MTEDNKTGARSAVEAAMYQATKHLRVITDADLAAVVDGRDVEPDSSPQIDIAFPPPGTTDHLFN